MKSMVIWYNPHKDIYYHKLVNGSYIATDYSIGYRNSYDHVIVHKIDDFDYYRKRVPIKRKVAKKLISFLNKI